MAFADERIAIN